MGFIVGIVILVIIVGFIIRTLPNIIAATVEAILRMFIGDRR